MSDTHAHTLELRDSNATLHARSGEIILLTGDSGSGKTGWLKRMAGLAVPPAGMRINIDGSDPGRHAVRMLFDRWPPIWLGQNVVEELTFGLKAQPDKQGLEKTLSDWALREVAPDTETESLNRAQSLRLTLAAISLASPALVLLDNPTAALPGTEAAAVIKKIADWIGQSESIVVVACNRWQDWASSASQRWCVTASDELPQLLQEQNGGQA